MTLTKSDIVDSVKKQGKMKSEVRGVYVKA